MTLRLQIEGPAGRMLANYRQRVTMNASGAIALRMPQAAEPMSVQIANGLTRAWQWVVDKRRAQLESRHLRVTETVSLGEKRFVAIVHVDGRQFLVGGGPTGVNLLAHLTQEPSEPCLQDGRDSSFPDILRQQLVGGQTGR